ncbi:hypothetical protein GCM10023353_01170 [Tomitella cavernea]|uniref:Resolvase/invertase-type recombinase catalytic domain-containing protein n=1 Tax=Tomitella cavernea TaxID=1387982 RepID=A0ABP9C0K5_9ACTN
MRVEFVAEHFTFALGDADPFATFQLHLLGAAAQLERSMIRERQREGIEAAKARGAYTGLALSIPKSSFSDAPMQALRISRIVSTRF